VSQGERMAHVKALPSFRRASLIVAVLRGNVCGHHADITEFESLGNPTTDRYVCRATDRNSLTTRRCDVTPLLSRGVRMIPAEQRPLPNGGGVSSFAGLMRGGDRCRAGGRSRHRAPHLRTVGASARPDNGRGRTPDLNPDLWARGVSLSSSCCGRSRMPSTSVAWLSGTIAIPVAVP
jgi:hypothetical protein